MAAVCWWSPSPASCQLWQLVTAVTASCPQSTLRPWWHCCYLPSGEDWQTHWTASLWPWLPWPSLISSCQVRGRRKSSALRFYPRTVDRTAGGSWAVCQGCSPRCTWRRGRWRRGKGRRGWPRRCCWLRLRPGWRSGPWPRPRIGQRSGTRCGGRHSSWCWSGDTEPRSNSHGAWKIFNEKYVSIYIE